MRRAGVFHKKKKEKKIVNDGETELRNSRHCGTSGECGNTRLLLPAAITTLSRRCSKVHTGDILMTWEIRWKKPILISLDPAFSRSSRSCALACDRSRGPVGTILSQKYCATLPSRRVFSRIRIGELAPFATQSCKITRRSFRAATIPAKDY